MPKRFYGTSAKDVLLEDPLRAFAIDAGVPDILRIDDDHWAVPALVHAARVIDADDALQPCSAAPFFKTSWTSFEPCVGHVLPEVQTKT